jgi:hypothetical protein
MAHETLLGAVERFLADTGMGASYFGQKAVSNSKLVSRLREGRPVETGTEAKIREFIMVEMERRRAEARRILRSASAHTAREASA